MNIQEELTHLHDRSSIILFAIYFETDVLALICSADLLKCARTCITDLAYRLWSRWRRSRSTQQRPAGVYQLRGCWRRECRDPFSLGLQSCGDIRSLCPRQGSHPTHAWEQSWLFLVHCSSQTGLLCLLVLSF